MKYPEYYPSFFYRNHHINTIFSSKFRKVPSFKYTRKRYETNDDDFIDIDILHGKSSRGLILLHGLEGSSKSIYIKSFAHFYNQMGYSVFAMNFRGCSGEPNRILQSYHGGKADDLDFVFNKVIQDYKIDNLAVVGFSLGANILLNYLANETFVKPKALTKCISISAPIDLKKSSSEISKKANFLYLNMFLKTLKEKAVEKNNTFKNSINIQKVLASKSFNEIDDALTAPIHGFNGADDYYKKCSSLFVLDKIKIDTLIISSFDDSFLSKTCFPTFKEHHNKVISTYYTQYGGHVGFGKDKKYKNLFLENLVLKYIDK